MSLPKDKRNARIMMHVCVVLGFMSITLAIMAIVLKLYIPASIMIVVGILQVYYYKQWQKKA